MFTVQSGRFLQALRDMQVQNTGLSEIAFAIRVPDEMIWWYWQEFGTALYAEKGTNNPFGYTVRPINKQSLHFYSRKDSSFHFAQETFVYGIPAKHMVENVLPEIRLTFFTGLTELLKANNYSLEAVREALLSEVMPQIKEIIRVAFEETFSNSPRPQGKLEGTAAEEFEQKATIEAI